MTNAFFKEELERMNRKADEAAQAGEYTEDATAEDEQDKYVYFAQI